MIQDLKDMMNLLNSDPELWDTIAKSYKNAYDALLRAGFSADQAMQIISRQGTGIKSS